MLGPTHQHVLLLFVAACIGFIPLEGTVLRWRNAGISSHWDDPTNWIEDGTGAAHIPTKEDDAVLGGTVDLRFYGVYTVTINRRDRPVEVHSLTLEQCEICAADLLEDKYSVWNGTAYRQLDDRYAADPVSRVNRYMGKEYVL
ncbi:hypothetical protein QOT17_010016 [Balamuthia mandrillaris]